MAESHLERLATESSRQQLVTEADAEHRDFADELAHLLDEVAEGGRVARAVREAGTTSTWATPTRLRRIVVLIPKS
jgi:hypothetical protein